LIVKYNICFKERIKVENNNLPTYYDEIVRQEDEKSVIDARSRNCPYLDTINRFVVRK
jgi:hypothetical protein